MIILLGKRALEMYRRLPEIAKWSQNISYHWQDVEQTSHDRQYTIHKTKEKQNNEVSLEQQDNRNAR